MNIVLCICTYRRPDGLRKLLDTLPKLHDSEGLQIIVVDNDAGEEGLAVCNSLPADYPFSLTAITQSEPGISAARNKAVTLALTLNPAFVAFLDDDEWPEPQWLAELKRVQRERESAVVGGPTRPVFPAGTEQHVQQNPYYGADMNLPDGTACQLQAGGNFLISAAALESMSPVYFHPAFAHSGGEDLAFFMQLATKGFSMHWAADAIVHEPVPTARLQDGWLRRRIINIHNSRVRVLQLQQPGVLPAVVRGLKTAALGIVAYCVSMAGLFAKNHHEQGQQLRWKFRGKLTAHLGRATERGESY